MGLRTAWFAPHRPGEHAHKADSSVSHVTINSQSAELLWAGFLSSQSAPAEAGPAWMQDRVRPGGLQSHRDGLGKFTEMRDLEGRRLDLILKQLKPLEGRGGGFLNGIQ